MPLTPDQIEQRTFALVTDGYDPEAVRRFLLEVAATVRVALHATNLTPAPAPAPAPSGGDPFERVGAEVAGVLRAAEDAATALRTEAEEEAAAVRAEAERELLALRSATDDEIGELLERARREADAVLQRAETDALTHHDRARRLLTAAQEQADAIVAEAEAQGKAVLANAREQADEHIRQVVLRARAHAEEILRAERDALRRLHEVQAQLAGAVDLLQHAEHRPIVDLTEARGTLRLGNLDVAAPGNGEPVEAGVEVRDPLVGMVRAAVDRAVQHSSRPADDEAAPV